jgi:hypothetical protein
MAKSLQERTKKDRRLNAPVFFMRLDGLLRPGRLVVEDIPHTQLDLVYIVQGL